MNEYEIYVPQAGHRKAVRRAVLNERKELIKYFGGITDTKYRNVGVWKVGQSQVKDVITVWKVVSNLGPAGDRVIRRARKRLENLLAQQEILVTKTLITKI